MAFPICLIVAFFNNKSAIEILWKIFYFVRKSESFEKGSLFQYMRGTTLFQDGKIIWKTVFQIGFLF